jgi:hypothetical protein
MMLSLAGCASSNPISPAAQLGAVNEAKVHAAVAAELLDPPSARFVGPLRMTKDGGVCGRVQGRNGFGGYSQPDIFYVSLEHGNVTRAYVGAMRNEGLFTPNALWRCLGVM